MKKRKAPTEAERLEKFFLDLERWMSYPTKAEMEQVLSRPCRWRKILEERNNNPDVSGK